MSFVNSNIPGACVAITPNDTAEHNIIAFITGGAGNVTVIDQSGNTTLITAPLVGTQIYLDIKTLKATGTTATAIVGFRAR